MSFRNLMFSKSQIQSDIRLTFVIFFICYFLWHVRFLAYGPHIVVLINQMAQNAVTLKRNTVRFLESY